MQSTTSSPRLATFARCRCQCSYWLNTLSSWIFVRFGARCRQSLRDVTDTSRHFFGQWSGCFWPKLTLNLIAWSENHGRPMPNVSLRHGRQALRQPLFLPTFPSSLPYPSQHSVSLSLFPFSLPSPPYHERPPNQLRVWGSAVSSHRGAPAKKAFSTFWAHNSGGVRKIPRLSESAPPENAFSYTLWLSVFHYKPWRLCTTIASYVFL